MKKALTAAAVAVLAAVLTVSAVAYAQTGPVDQGGAPADNNGHPNVGALLRQRTDGSLTILCSGTLVAYHVFLTAGHCSDYLFSVGQTTAYVTFDPYFGTDTGHTIVSTPYKGTVIENPDWHKPIQNDTAIVLFDDATANLLRAEGIVPAAIAPLHLLDGLKASHALDGLDYLNVGYGTAQQQIVKGSGPTLPFDGTRKWTISGYHALDSEYIHLDQNIHRDLYGSCNGDSGGPTFITLGGSTYVISVVSTGDIPCYSTSVNERVDTDNAQQFLAPYLALG